MALIADLCPHCHRITRCHVSEQWAITGGIVLGIPFVLPQSSVSCTCGECGFEFRSEHWNYARAVSPAEAVALDIEALLDQTNPALKEKVTLAELKAVPQLSEAIHLLDGLMPGSLRTALKEALLRWRSLDAGQQERFLASVDDCSRALQFARMMASRYPLGVVEWLVGILGCVVTWSGCLLVLGTRLTGWGWLGVIAGGFFTGVLLIAQLGSKREVRWVKGVLLPEAERSGIRPGALLAVLEGTGLSKQVGDELSLLRQVAPAIRAELAAAGKSGEVFDFGVAQKALS
jgi:hypothetical protein